MAVRPDVPGTGQTGPRPLRRPEAGVRRRPGANRRPPTPSPIAPAPRRRPPASSRAGCSCWWGQRPRPSPSPGCARSPGWSPRCSWRWSWSSPSPPSSAGCAGIGAPNWLATTVLLVLVWSVLLSFVALLVLAIAQMAALLPDYAGRAEVLINGVVNDLNDAGIVSGQLSDLVEQIDYSQLVGVATGLLSGLTDAASTLVLLLTALVFVAIESSGFGRRMALVAAERPHLPVALSLFTQGTRSYLLVSTVFGAIVAIGRLDRPVHHRHPRRRHLGPAGVRHQLRAQHRVRPRRRSARAPRSAGRRLGRVHGRRGRLLAAQLRRADPDPAAVRRRLRGPVDDGHVLRAAVLGLGLGALGALLAIPLTLLVKVLLVDVDPRGHWLDARAPRGAACAAHHAGQAPDARPPGRTGLGPQAAPSAPEPRHGRRRQPRLRPPVRAPAPSRAVDLARLFP